MSRLLAKIRLVLLFFAAFSGTLRASEYQWSVTMEPTIPDVSKHPRAFLWIPPNCQRVRAVVIGQHNMIEEGILEHPYFRQTMSDLGFAVVWISPSFDYVFHFEAGAGDHITKLMHDLAAESGYSEMEFAPIVPIGHSAHASYPWNFAAWNPSRTLALLSVHGDAPLTNRTGSGKPNPDWGDRQIDGVPGLMVMGEYEWHQDRLDPAIEFQKKHPAVPISVVADVGHGHFDYSDETIRYLCLFLRKAAALRLPETAPLEGPVPLTNIDPQQGWLVDQWRKGQPLKAAAAPFKSYAGPRDEAFWTFDKETAMAATHFNNQSGRLPQLLGFEQGEKVIEQAETHQQVPIKFTPLEDGISFLLKGVFIDKVPGGNPVLWSGLPEGSPITHATGGGPVTVSRIAGPMMQTGPVKWSIHYNRGTDATDLNGINDLWFLASHEGDDSHKSAVQQALLTIPWRNTEGSEQKITFPTIPDQTNATSFLKLNASSDSGAPVGYYVREGPAEMEGDILKFTSIPPRAKYPIKVTVVAWQWGRSREPKLKTAEPVVQTFLIQNP